MNIGQQYSSFNATSRGGREFLSQLVNMFEQNGWLVKGGPFVGDRAPDLVISRGSLSYIVELKVASEGRRDRLVPLLSQAVLQARAIAGTWPSPARRCQSLLRP